MMFDPRMLGAELVLRSVAKMPEEGVVLVSVAKMFEEEVVLRSVAKMFDVEVVLVSEPKMPDDEVVLTLDPKRLEGVVESASLFSSVLPNSDGVFGVLQEITLSNVNTCHNILNNIAESNNSDL